MSIKILMPALSPTMTEGNLTKWLIKVGDQVKAGDILAEIETDKATMEVEAVDEGNVIKLLVEEGATEVLVNSTIALLDGGGSDDEEVDHDTKKLNDNVNDENLIKNDLDVDNNSNENLKKKLNFKSNKDTNKIIASPYVRKFSKIHNINIDAIDGSGPNGRIIKRDLEKNKDKDNSINKNDNKTIKPSQIRKIIAEKTTITKQTVPHFYLTIESNVDKLLEMRKKINEQSEIKISINDILVKALAEAQKMNPLTNVSWVEGEIVQYKSVDVSIAVALQEGLITPVIKNADQKGLKEISNEIKYLANKAKKGLLQPNEYTGGTISISNLGMFGISEFIAIINPPQSSILAVGSIKKMTVVDINNDIKVSSILKSTLSADHRVLDGSVAGKLLKDFNDIVEEPFKLWLNSKDLEII